MRTQALLEVTALEAAYGASQVLFGIEFMVAKGEVVALLGRNGMGKTTTIRALFGILRPIAGSIRFANEELAGRPSHEIARRGLSLVPEGRQIFPNLTVEENLTTTASKSGAKPRWTLDRVYALFPKLIERRRNMGDQLSGGEQQMLAIGRALMTNPRLLVLDEATEGLSPVARNGIWRILEELKRERLSILIIDKDIEALGRFADRHYILEKGGIAWHGTSAELASTPELKRYLAV
jgi:branched-chain amino acid transport system ATP-binding protein